MNHSNQKWSKDLLDIIIGATQYSGSGETHQKKISASSLGSEPMQNLMRYFYGVPKDTEFGGHTVGSIYQLGLDSIFEEHNEKLISEGKEPRYGIATRNEVELENGWKVSGETDIEDHQEKKIIDAKVLSAYSFKDKTTKSNKMDDYNLQQAVYVWIKKTLTGEDYTAALHAINKGGSAAKGNNICHIELDLFTLEEVESLLIKRTDKLEAYIQEFKNPEELFKYFAKEIKDKTKNPDACDPFKFGATKGVPNRCLNYCSYNDKCPIGKEYTRRDINNTLDKITNVQNNINKKAKTINF